jgi:hypothetical protein
MTETKERKIEVLNELETRMDGFAGRNWRDEYPGYEQLTIVEQIETLLAAIAEYED